MRPEERDAAYLWDMREAASDIVEFVRGVTYDEFTRDTKVRYAVERQLIVIGEASKGVSDSFKARHPEIPWRTIVAQRNILAHEYGEVLADRVWLAATEDVPRLLDLLAPLVPPPPEE